MDIKFQFCKMNVHSAVHSGLTIFVKRGRSHVKRSYHKTTTKTKGCEEASGGDECVCCLGGGDGLRGLTGARLISLCALNSSSLFVHSLYRKNLF